MSISKNKDLVCLLTAVVSDMMDDSDEGEDIIPLSALMEAKKAEVENKPPPAKLSKSEKPKTVRSIDKYSQPSRFEGPYTSRPVTSVNFEQLICNTTLKPTSECLCSCHINLESLPFFSLLVKQSGGASISDLDFKTNWHMSKETVEALYQVLFNNNSDTPGVSALEFLAFLWGLASSETSDAVENRFKMAKGEISLLERKIYDVLLSKRFSYERWPQGIAANLVSEGFQSICGFLGALGVVDCVHLSFIGTPYPGTFQNRNGEITIIVELACDHRGVFTYSSYFWWPGKWSHMEVHRHSTLHTYPIPDGFFLLANRSYARCNNYIAPYADAKTLAMKRFNQQHLRANNILKNAVARLVTRFNTVKYFSERTPWVLRKRFAACLLLHNLCTELEGPIDIDNKIDLGPFFPKSLLPTDCDAESDLRNRIVNEMVCFPY